MTLHLSLKEKWYRMIESGEKPEEYRKMTPYWNKRIAGKHYDVVEFSLGYPRRDDTSRRMRFSILRITTGYGYTQWGAPVDEEVHIIMLKNRL